jgi:hypothetical protein
MNLDSALGTIGGWLKSIVSLGLTLALTMLVVDVIIPNETDIVGNVADLVGRFTDNGLAGLITLIVLVAIASGD